MSRKNVIGVFILFLGVFIGVLLVQQSQEYRERAEDRKKIVTICHRLDSSDKPLVEIEVEEKDLKFYIDQGDVLGGCPEEIE